MATDFISEAYSAHHEHLHRYLTSITRDRDLADDFAQEAYARLAREVGQGRAPRHMRAWLFRAGRNLAIDRGRRQQVAVRLMDRFRDDSDVRSAEDECLLRENRRDLGRVLAQVSSVDRTALQMAAEGYSGAEIANALGMSEAAVRTRLCRARGRLRTLLGPVS
jgi:RNA polymerase sigma-70 factor (ECF subfamily)